MNRHRKSEVKLFSSLFVLILILFLQNCSGNKNETGHKMLNPGSAIIVYGSRECIHCVRFMASLDSAGILYKFFDVEKDQNRFQEMYQKIKKNDIKGYISYPVVEINGNLYVRPDIKTVKEHLIK